MGVYIKGMEMPTSCYACMFFAQTNYWNKKDEADILSHCKSTGEKTWESVNGYLPNCPLVPVPPHGRLIDADKLCLSSGFSTATEYGRGRSDQIEAIKSNAPTIIPAEEGE